MMFVKSVSLVLIIISTVSCQLHPSNLVVSDIAGKLSDLITAKAEGRRRLTFPFIAGFVRLAFHDCSGNGRCDGCIDHNLPDNAGLKRYTDELDLLYQSDPSEIFNKMTRADFYMLAGYVALERATEFASVSFSRADNFRTGRVSCGSTPNEIEDPGFPSGMGKFSAAHTFFGNQFGFTLTDSVAIMGAHTLGRCSAENSGFEGRWVLGRSGVTAKSDMLDNEYYLQMRGNWTQFGVVSGGAVRNQWQRPRTTVPNNPSQGNNNQPQMFLNVDLDIQWNLETFTDIDSNNGKVTCEVIVDNGACFTDLCCDRAATNSGRVDNLFRKYVNSNSDWLADFTIAYNKMVESNPGVTFQKPT